MTSDETNKDLFVERGFQDPALSTGEQDNPLEKVPNLDTSIVSERTGGTFSPSNHEPVASNTGKPCPHQLWELDTAVQDGYCALCMRSKIASLESSLEGMKKQNEELEISEKKWIKHAIEIEARLRSELKTAEDKLAEANKIILGNLNGK